jgi:CelD/BcsL family acetyltransferase involved in cellulose biosynthesis
MTENIHIAYDFAYARFSPGLLLDRYVLQWAFERGIAYDFHFGTDDRKRALGNANCDVVTSNYYRTAWAWVYEYLRLCRNAQLVRRLRRCGPFRPGDASNHQEPKRPVSADGSSAACNSYTRIRAGL